MGFGKKLEDLMSAITFAEEGEFQTAREMMSEDRRVLLAVKEDQVDGKTLKYALSICSRVGAGLDILHVSAKGKVGGVVEEVLAALRKKGFDYRLKEKRGCLKNQIIDYTDKEKGVLFVVTQSSDNLDVECRRKDRKLSTAWKNLKCPLVMVSELEAT